MAVKLGGNIKSKLTIEISYITGAVDIVENVKRYSEIDHAYLHIECENNEQLIVPFRNVLTFKIMDNR